MTHLLLAIGLFLATHVALAEAPLRPALVRALGEKPFLWAYGAIAMLQLLWIGWAVAAAPVVAYWQPPSWTHAVPLLAMPVALLLIVCGFTQNNPTATMAPAKAARRDVVGVLAITRHPVMWGLGLWSLSHLAVVSNTAQALRFLCFAVLALAFLPRIEAKQRAKWGEAAWTDFAARSSNLPFLALLQGRATLRWAEIGWARSGAAAVLYLGMLAGGHAWLTGLAAW